MSGAKHRRARAGGRPSRAAATAKVLATLQAAGIDAADIDPKLILRSIAADTSAPASARVTACRLLMATSAEPGVPSADAAASEEAREWRRLVGNRGGKA